MTQPAPTPKKAHHRHDRSRRKIFTHRRAVADLLKGFVRGDWVRGLDFSTLRKLPGDYIFKGLGERLGDVVWEVKSQRQSLYVLILEFQSRKEPFMAAQLLLYVGLLFDRLIKEYGLKEGDLLPPVVPIVFYNGDDDYDVALSVSELIATARPELARFQPELEYLLIQELSYPVEGFADVENVVGKMLRLQQSDPRRIREIVGHELDWIEEKEPGLMEDVLEWIELGLLPDRQKDTPIPDFGTLDELKMYMETDMKSWNDILKDEGRAEGAANVVLSLVEEKFGALSDAVKTRIRTADSEHLLEWAKRILTAQRLEEVFGDAN